MSKPKVLVTRLIPGPGMDLVRRNCALSLWKPDRPMPREILLKRVKGVSGIICLLTDRIDKAVMDAAGPGLKVISTMAVGFDNIDVTEATRRGVFVGHTPGVLTEATADLTWALILSSARRIVEGDRMMREKRFTGWSPTMLLGADFCQSTIGIIGMGRIGKAVARRAAGFGMRVIYHDAERLPAGQESELRARYAPLEKLIRESDFISLHCPFNNETYHLIGKKELAMMKKSAYLINVARGPVVDEKALVSALRNKKIAGAALDVYEREPRLTAGLTALKNAVLVPHLGSASINTRNKMALMAAQNLLSGLRGQVPKWCVNPEAKS